MAHGSSSSSLKHVSKKRKMEEAVMRERRRREYERIAELLDTPTKKYGSTRRLGAGRRGGYATVAEPTPPPRPAVVDLFGADDSDSELSSESEPEDNDDVEKDKDGSEDEEESDDDDDDSDSASSAPDESTFGSSDDDNDHEGSDSDEDTAITSDEDFDDQANSSDEEWEGEGTSGKRTRRGGSGGLLSTPRKQAKLSSGAVTSTPRARERILGTVTSTPHLPARPLNMVTLSVGDLQGLSPQARAKKLLHVGATPERLPCREDQYEEVLACVEDAVQDGIGGCVYVSGVPGVGKTATVREAIRSLKCRAKAGVIAPFRFVEVNGMKLNDAQDAYSLLWQTVSGGERCSNRMALQRLSQHFSAGGGHARTRDDAKTKKKKITTVVLMDELDQLVTTRQEVMYNMFNWPNSADSGLIVIAVANTMDLPERILNPKVASRLGMTRITFKPYNDKQLVEIVQSRLGIGRQQQSIADTDEQGEHAQIERALTKDCDQVFSADAIVFVSKRVSNVSGDARRMLDVCRRAIDSVEMQSESSSSSSSSSLSSSSASSQSTPTIRQVTINDVKKVLDSMVKSGKVSHIIKLSLHAKVALIATLACARRSGVAEIDLGAILAHHRTLCHMQQISVGNLPSSTTIDVRSMAPVMAQLCALGLLIAVGNGAGNARGGVHARFLLACQEDEVRLALEQDPDSRLRRML